jgi:DNA-binding FadR family transcriptional regulator
MNTTFTTKSKADQVAQSLLDGIVEAGLKPGSSLGTEAQLLEKYHVSRPTLRESLRILESQGVLELRQGPGGGILVKRPSAEVLAHGLSVFLCLNDVPFIDVVKAREAIEPALAAEAASSGTEQDFDELAQSIERMKAIEDNESFVIENRKFHLIIARAGGNKVLETFWATISILAQGEQVGVRYSAGNRQHVIEAHKRILAALRARDAKAAASHMASHVTELEHLVRKRYQGSMKAPMRVFPRMGRR